jgi:hypothetical protein
MDDWPNDLLGVPTDSPMAAAVALAELRALLNSVRSGSLGASLFMNGTPFTLSPS